MLSEDSDGEDVHTLAINEHYAKAFEYRKEREELSKLKEKYGSDAEEDDPEDSEEAESEDEDGEELTPAVDAAILRTLARIKRQDPEIYATEKSIFEEEQKRTTAIKSYSRVTEIKSKPITMRQVALESALNAASRSPSPSPQPLPHVEEQHALRSETIAVFHNAVKDNDNDDLLIPREKTTDEIGKEEEEYREFLTREVGEDLEGLITIEEDVIGSMESETNEVKQKKRKESKDKGKGKATQETDQEFLMNYILNRGWIDHSANHIPTYKEVTSSSISKGKLKKVSSDEEGPDVNYDGADIDAEDDEEFEEIVERFESSYNFRFEEPDAAVIKGYPRNLPSVVRREDTSRKEARERRKQRKEEELAKKREEVKRLKGLKMKELRAKLERIGREGGKNIDETKALQDLDLEGDWDPESHDQQMAGLYGNDDPDLDDKPQWDDDIDVRDIISETEEHISNKKKKKKKKKDKAPAEEDEGVDVDAMDADVQHGTDEEEWDGTEEMRKRKLDEYMDEIYGLDFNDMVGDLPTRFKYTPVQPQSFALTPAEILTATDSELNQYLSVKKYAPYRKENNWDKGRVDRLKELKQTVAERSQGMGMSGGGSYQDVNGERANKRKGKKERLKMKAAADGVVEGGDNVRVEMEVGNKLNGKREHENMEETETAQDDTTLGGKKRRRHTKKMEQT